MVDPYQVFGPREFSRAERDSTRDPVGRVVGYRFRSAETSRATAPTTTTTAMSTDHESRGTDTASTAEFVVEAGTIQTTLAAAGALVDECLLRADEDGLVLRARDPADVAMAELSLDPGAFESYDVADERVGLRLDRVIDAVSLAEADAPVRVTRTDGRLRIVADEFEYTTAPVDPNAVRSVEWIDHESTAASVSLPAAELRRAVRAADLVAEHAVFTVAPEADEFAVAADGDTDDVRLAFDDRRLDADARPVDSIYSVDYLGKIVGTVPSDATVTLEFVDAEGDGGDPLIVRYPFADGDGRGRWVLAPRIRR